MATRDPAPWMSCDPASTASATAGPPRYGIVCGRPTRGIATNPDQPATHIAVGTRHKPAAAATSAAVAAGVYTASIIPGRPPVGVRGVRLSGATRPRTVRTGQADTRDSGGRTGARAGGA